MFVSRTCLPGACNVSSTITSAPFDPQSNAVVAIGAESPRPRGWYDDRPGRSDGKVVVITGRIIGKAEIIAETPNTPSTSRIKEVDRGSDRNRLASLSLAVEQRISVAEVLDQGRRFGIFDGKTWDLCLVTNRCRSIEPGPYRRTQRSSMPRPVSTQVPTV